MSEPIEGTGEGFSSPSPSEPVTERRFGAESEEDTTHKAAEVLEQGKEKAKELGAKAQEQLMSKADTFRSDTAQRLHRFADAIDDLAREDGHDELRPLARSASRFVHRAGELIDEHSAEELVERVRTEVRDRPAWVLLGMAAVGFVGARLLKE